MNRIGILVTLLFLTSIEGSRRVTVVRMTTETTTTTTTISTNTACFLLQTEEGVPMTPCRRRRRQHWIEEPLFLAPRGQVDEDLSQFVIKPKETFQVEPTLLPGAGFNGYSGLNQGGYGSPDPLAKHSVQSSLFVPVSSEHQRFIFGSPLFLRRIWAYLANDLYRGDDEKRTVIKVSVTTETTTFTKSTSTVCLTLISEGGVGPTPCRRRRQFWIEEPMFLEPYNHFDDYYSQFIIQPSSVFQLETTAAPSMEFRNDPFYGNDDEYDTDFFLPHLPQSSLWMPTTDFRPRIYFKNGGPFAMGGYRKGGNNKPSKTSKKTTITFTRTTLVTETEMSTKTHSIGIAVCTPSPLYYDICT
ncbi:hypothetical protein GHT06_010953 [Daphnia sinensis]|uniref:Uncharacterized protein n=1 Tax=Daphnia sinensis TaxID=1820382 RepID=A0AAD5Q1N9_9CRUS|nr:hypothetical protein GHT06_010953 [Daphnia sinensis]